jgi:hypothetical protein
MLVEPILQTPQQIKVHMHFGLAFRFTPFPATTW